MKRIISVITALLFAHVSSAQLEFSIGINSTFTHFRGEGVDPFIYLSSSSGSETIQPYNGFYGAKMGIGWSIEGTAQRKVGKAGFVLGVGIGYERLNSRLLLIREIPNTTTTEFKSYQSHSLFDFINLYPYLGKQFTLGKHIIEGDLGAEIGLPLSADLKVKGDATYKTRKPEGDFRLRLQAKWYYKQYGLLAGYALGVLDYHSLVNFSKYTAYSSVIKIGGFYTFSHKKNK